MRFHFFQAIKTKEGVDCDGGSDLLPSDNESVNTDKPSLDRQVVVTDVANIF